MSDTDRSSPASEASAPFSMGNALAATFSIFGRNAIPFTLVTAIAMVPLLVYVIWIASTPREYSEWIALILGLVLGPVATGAVTFGVVQEARGQRASLVTSITMGLQRVLPVLAVAILQGVIIVLGLVACIVPGLIFWTMLLVAVPVAVIEKPGVVEALRRSDELTRGYRWPILGCVVVLILLKIGIEVALQIVFADDFGTHLIVAHTIEIVIAAITSVAGAVVYYQLRVTKEGAHLDDIAKVFD